MKPFQLLIKPVSGDCNLACSYCFYRRVPAQLYPDATTHRMDDAVLEAIIRDFLGYGFSPSVMCWQGGEPTLAGLDFFKRVVELQKKHASPGQVVGNAFQTNGLLIDDDWSRFLSEYRFLVGLSIDGPAYLHDAQRAHESGSGSWRQAMRTARRFVRDNVAFNVLSVVSRENESKGKEVFQWFASQGFTHLQFIPCVEVDPATGKVSDYSVTPEGFGKFLCDVFDEWIRLGATRVSVRDFDSMIRFYLEGQHDICTFRKDCGSYLLIEHNGDVYPCDFFAAPEWLLGRVGDMSLEAFFETDRMKSFIHSKRADFAECAACPWQKNCFGGCPKDRLVFGSVESHPSYLCASYKKFFDHTSQGFQRIAEELRRRRAATPPQ